MRKKLSIVILGIAALTALSVGILTASADNDVKKSSSMMYRVSITNLTKGQPISPVLVATHNKNLDPLFTLGEPASDALAAVAEDANNGPLMEILDPEENENVRDLQTIFGVNGPILPGETASVMIQASGKSKMFSLVGMFVNTNDAFGALNGMNLPRRGSKSFVVAVYDSGSEANNEDCGFIPGPACGSPGVRAEDGAEGYVYIHNGVHGIADLDPAMHDWRNPGALVIVERVK